METDAVISSSNSSSDKEKNNSQYPKVAVAVAVVHPKRQEVLLVPVTSSSLTTVPRGDVNYGESVLDAVTRITKENGGFELDKISLLGVQEAIFDSEFGSKEHMHFDMFFARAKEPLPEGLYKWVNKQQASETPMSESTREILERCFNELKRK